MQAALLATQTPADAPTEVVEPEEEIAVDFEADDADDTVPANAGKEASLLFQVHLSLIHCPPPGGSTLPSQSHMYHSVPKYRSRPRSEH